MTTVAHQFAEPLTAAGVKRFYCVGDSLNGLTDALRRPGKIEWVYAAREGRCLRGGHRCR
jgi:pyruvate dehydrogenase (quinone)